MNRTDFLNIETAEQVTRYLDELCSDPNFLCKPNHREMCANSTSIYSGIKNVDNICNNISQANICENDFSECIVLATNLLGDSQKYISTSFVNIIIPIPKVLDTDGNQKFIRLPALKSNKKENSFETCSICSCMNRFATSPGGADHSGTAPGQNECLYVDTFEYYYYPVDIVNINKKIKDAPYVKLKNYTVIDNNIISIYSDDDLKPLRLYNILLNNGISKYLSKNFITNVLYKNNLEVANELKSV